MSSLKIIEPSSLKLWLPFNGSLVDASGNGHNGTVIGSPTYVDGITGQAISNNNGNNAVSLGTTSITSGMSKVTLSMWVKLTNTISVDAALYYESTSQTGYIKFGFYQVPATNKLRFCSRGATTGALKYVDTPAALTTGVFYHVVGVFDSDTNQQEIFINGTSAANNTTDVGPIYLGGLADPIGVGYYSPASAKAYCQAVIDDLRIYARAFSANEISAMYFAKRGQLCG